MSVTLSKHPSRHCCILNTVGVGGGGGNEGGTSSITNPLRDSTSVIRTVFISVTIIFQFLLFIFIKYLQIFLTLIINYMLLHRSRCFNASKFLISFQRTSNIYDFLY